jgi:superfamily I DNA/RNA helicase
MRIVTRLLKPGGHLFLCDDPSQSVYRYYSWRQKGVEVRGRTRWLRIPYRNTRQIFEAAYTLIADDPLAQRLLAECGEGVHPDLDSAAMRDGPRPQVHCFPSWAAEREFVVQEIETLVRQAGMLPTEIGILHEKKHVHDRYRPLVPQGVQLYEVKRQTGLEYKAVFIPKLQDMFDRTGDISWEEHVGRERLKSYMTMTRARTRLYLLYEGKWPRLLEPIRPYVDWIAH